MCRHGAQIKRPSCQNDPLADAALNFYDPACDAVSSIDETCYVWLFRWRSGCNEIDEDYHFTDDIFEYNQTSNIRRTISKNLNAFRHVLQVSLPNPLKPGVKSRIKMSLEQRLHIRYLTVHFLEWFFLYIVWTFTEFCWHGSSLHYFQFTVWGRSGHRPIPEPAFTNTCISYVL